MENKDFIISKFKEVKSLEYVPSNRSQQYWDWKNI